MWSEANLLSGSSSTLARAKVETGMGPPGARRSCADHVRRNQVPALNGSTCASPIGRGSCGATAQSVLVRPAEPAQVLLVAEELEAPPHDAAGDGLAGVAVDCPALQGAVHGHAQVDVVAGVSVEGGAVLMAQLSGHRVRDGPAQHRQVEGFGGLDGGGGGVGVVRMAGNSGEVEGDDAIRLDVAGRCGDVGGELVEVDVGKASIGIGPIDPEKCGTSVVIGGSG